jgi:CheY-like chemotaxis protein
MLNQQKPRAILVVDDEPTSRELISLMLEQRGYQVATANDGRAGELCLAQKTFDLVITDLLMPERDGLELIGALRRGHPDTHIIAITGGGHLPGSKYLQLARGLGAHTLLEKPFSQAALLGAVDLAFAPVVAIATPEPPA